jgi:hypothetical protein
MFANAWMDVEEERMERNKEEWVDIASEKCEVRRKILLCRMIRNPNWSELNCIVTAPTMSLNGPCHEQGHLRKFSNKHRSG